jgi:hypothetical protein
MSSIIKVDQIQLADGSTPTAGDLGLNTTGSVLQVVQGQYDIATSVNSGTPTSIIDLNITPSSTSSKILVTTQLWLWHRNYYTGYAGIFRGSLDITLGTDTSNYDDNFTSPTPYKGGGIGVRTAESGASTTNWAPFSFSHTLLDSPSSDTQLTYSVKVWANDSGSGSDHPILINRGSGQTNSPRPICTLTLQEIAG